MRKGRTKRGNDLKKTLALREPDVRKTWALVAHRSGARLFQAEDSKKFELIRELPFPEGRKKDNEYRRDQAGRSFESGRRFNVSHGNGPVRHALSSQVSHHDQAADKFARYLANVLKKGQQSREYSKLVVVAEPRFMGKLNAAMTSSTSRKITSKIELDLEKLSEAALRKRLSILVAA